MQTHSCQGNNLMHSHVLIIRSGLVMQLKFESAVLQKSSDKSLKL